MEDEIKRKKYYIYENIDKIKNHDQIIDLINIKACKFTKNSNGIFLNLSALEDELINLIYQIIINLMDYEENNESTINQSHDNIYIDKETINNEDIIINGDMDNNVYQKKARFTLQLQDFTNNEQEIINASKKYNL